MSRTKGKNLMTSLRPTTLHLALSTSLALGVFLSATGCGGGSSGGGGSGLAVSSVSPADDATSVPTNTKVNATFNQDINPAALDVTTFRVTGPGSTPVSGNIDFAEGRTATFDPSNDLVGNTTFTGRITTGAGLGSDFVWTFTTGTTADTTRPTVTVTSPLDGATNVPLNRVVTVAFNEPMDPSTITEGTFTLNDGSSVDGVVTYSDTGRSATFTPDEPLLPSTDYTATVTVGVDDLAGNNLANNVSWTFTTGTGTDTARPTVTSTNPSSNATNVATNKKVNATFSEPMDPDTITNGSYTLVGPSGAVQGLVTYDALSRIATFSPSANLASATQYTARVTTAAADLANNTLASDRVWSFTTGNAAQDQQAPINLRSAGLYAVLAGGGITNVPTSDVNGDAGSFPTASIDLSDAEVDGTIHRADAAAGIAQGDLTTAYNEAQGRTLNEIPLTAVNIGGQTLAPGLYSHASSIEITGSNLTLDAQGDSSAVWIFKTAGTLLVDTDRAVILAGGAKASNVFWAVGTSATLGTRAAMKGTIMADQQVSMANLATLDGRALARIASVTLDMNTVTIPPP